MPKTSAKSLATKKAYNAKPENVAKRVKNNQARLTAIKEGRAKVGDGTQVDHVKPLDKGGGNDKSNLRVTSAEFNKGWRGRQPEMYGKK